MDVKKLWTIEVKSVQYSSTFVKHSTQSPTNHFCTNSSSESISLKMDTELSSRTQSVVLGGAQSNRLPVVSGVLFLIYIDGVSNSVLHSKLATYADDIALYKMIRNPSDYTYLQRDVTSMFLGIDQLFDFKRYKVLLYGIL